MRRKTSTPPTGDRENPGLAARIVDAAERRLGDDGDPAALSLRAIARDVGVTAPAIYTHFAGKDEIVTAVLARQFGELDAALDAATATAEGARARLSALCIAYCRFAADRPGRYRLLFGADATYYGVAFDGSPGAASFARLVEAVRAVDPAASARDRHRTASVLWPALHGIASLRSDASEFPWPPLPEQIELLIDGLLPAPGPAQSPE